MPNLTFPMPEGFIPPENLDSDDTFQAMATFKLVSDNELQLTDIEGYQIGKEDTEGDTEAAAQADQGSIQSALQNAGSAAGAEANMAGPAGAGPAGAKPPPGTQASMPTPTYGEQLRARFRAATGRR